MGRRSLMLIVLAAAFTTPLAAFADESALDSVFAKRGYVSVPIERGHGKRLSVKGKLHGAELDLMLDFSNDVVLVDIRELRKLDIAAEKTGETVNTPRKTVQFYQGEVLGLEFAGRSTGLMTIYGADIDALYAVRPGAEGLDGVLGLEFLKSYGAVIDVANMRLYLKMR